MLWLLALLLPILVGANPLAIAQFIYQLTSQQYTGNLSGAPLPEGWTNCGSDEDAFQLYSLEITPNPPRRGEELRVRVRGWLREPIPNDQAARVSYVVHYGGIQLLQEDRGVCDALTQDALLPQCPIANKWWDYEYRVQVSAMVPMGTYSVEAAGEMADGRRLFCMKGETRIALFS